MAWGAKKQGLEDICKRLRENDPSLGSLTLFHTRRCNEDDLDMLFSAVKGNTILKELIILPCHVVNPPSAAKAAEMLLQDQTLQSLSLGHHEFGDAGIMALAPGISGGRLWRLDLENKGVGQQGVECLANHLGCLKELNLSKNQLGNHGLLSLLTSTAAGSLETLTVQSCGVTFQDSLVSEGVRAESLTLLDLSSNVLLATGYDHSLSSLISSLTKLKELKLRDCELSTQVASSVLNATGASIIALDISGRQSFGDDAFLIAHESQLESLNLGRYYNSSEQEGVSSSSSEGNVITLSGVRLLSSFSRLTSLDLTGACLKGDPVLCKEAFLDLGSQCTRLRHLRLVGTGLGDQGVMALASTCECFGLLEELSVSACGLTVNGLCEFFSAIRGSSSRFPKISSLECGANIPGDEEALSSTIQSLIEARPALAVHCRNALEDTGGTQ